MTTSTDLLLAFHVKQTAATLKRRDIRLATGLEPGDDGYDQARESWHKSIESYIHDVVADLQFVSDVIQSKVNKT